MSFAGKNLTQGGQMTAYRWRMFIQVNNWIGFWIFILFALLTSAIFFWRIPQETLDNGSLWWFASLNSSFINLMPASGTPGVYDVHYWYAPTATSMVLKMTLPQIYTDPYMQAMGEQCQTALLWAAGGSSIFSMAVFIAVTWFIADVGRKESEDQYISGMQLTDKPSEVNRLLRKNGELSDLRVGDLHMVRMAEVLNFLMHGTIGVGKSTLIRWLLNFIRQRGDRAIIYDSGCIRLKGENGRVTINPENVRAQQHIDYGWAVTGYGAQGTSSDYVIALEGTAEGRKALASRRAFYISASRVKEHVQIYTDGKADWVKAVKTPERDIKTAHDALAPETQRQQAKAIWAMGQPVNRTGIGRAWIRHQGMGEASLTAKIIPATRRFPEPALALPVYDNNGKSAGLALVSLVSSPEGRLTQGDTRMVMTERAQGAVLQRSRSGNTIVVSDLPAALDAVRTHPEDGVVWQTGNNVPSSWLLKVSGGTTQERPPELTPTLMEAERAQRQQEQRVAEQVRQDESARNPRAERESVTLPPEEVVRLKPEDLHPTRPEPFTPDDSLIDRVRRDESPDAHDRHAVSEVRLERASMDKSAREQARASEVITRLADDERHILHATDTGERGRMPEQDEQTHHRTIQKER